MLTRPAARRDARRLFDLVAGFVYSQVLLACVRLQLFDTLAESPRSAEALAERWAMPLESARRLLDAAVCLELCAVRSDGRYDLGRLGAPMVGNRPIAAMVEHHEALYRDLVDPLALLHRSRPPAPAEGAGPVAVQDPPAGSVAGAVAGYWPYARRADAAALEDGRIARYTALMSASQPLVADEVLRAWRFDRHRCVMDVGGGDGTFLERLGRRHPGLGLKLFDLPAVAERARLRLTQAGFDDRITIHGGSFLGPDPLPAGADLITLLRVVHDHDDEAALHILRAVRAALPPQGVLLLAEPMAAARGAPTMGDAYFGLYLLAMGQGRPRREETLTQMLHEAGFSRVRALSTAIPLQTGILVAFAS